MGIIEGDKLPSSAHSGSIDVGFRLADLALPELEGDRVTVGLVDLHGKREVLAPAAKARGDVAVGKDWHARDDEIAERGVHLEIVVGFGGI